MSIENEALRLMVSELNVAIIGAKWERDETLRELRALEWLILWSQGAVKNGPDVTERVVSPICVAGAGVLVANASQSKRYPDYTSAALAQGWEEK